MGRVPQSTGPHDLTTTHWSEIQAARTSSPERRQVVLNALVRRYWKPVYHYLRARGHQDADARDCTQDFFVDVVLGRDLFGQADEARGRFRPFLLRCLKNFVRDQHRRVQARRRTPSALLVSIDQWADSEASRFEPPAPDTSPEAVFHRRWAAALVEAVLDRLARSCEQSGLAQHLDIFRQRVIRPALDRVSPTPVEELAARYGLTAKQVTNRCETVRRRFRALLLSEVRLTVMDEAAAEEELRSLMQHLAQPKG